MRLYLRSGGKLRQWRGDADGIARAWAALPAEGRATMAAQGSGGDPIFGRSLEEDLGSGAAALGART